MSLRHIMSIYYVGMGNGFILTAHFVSITWNCSVFTLKIERKRAKILLGKISFRRDNLQAGLMAASDSSISKRCCHHLTTYGESLSYLDVCTTLWHLSIPVLLSQLFIFRTRFNQVKNVKVTFTLILPVAIDRNKTVWSINNIRFLGDVHVCR